MLVFWYTVLFSIIDRQKQDFKSLINDFRFLYQPMERKMSRWTLGTPLPPSIYSLAPQTRRRHSLIGKTVAPEHKLLHIPPLSCAYPYDQLVNRIDFQHYMYNQECSEDILAAKWVEFSLFLYDFFVKVYVF